VQRVFCSVKHEGLDDTAPEQLPETVIEYMEMFYNFHWLHSTLGYLIAKAFEAQAQGLPLQPGGPLGERKGIARWEIV